MNHYRIIPDKKDGWLMMKNVKRLLSLALCLIMAFSAVPAALASGITEVPITSITFQENSATLRIGGTVQIQAFINPGNTTQSLGVIYQSMSPSVASVTSYGVVTGLSYGTAVIRVTSAANSSIYNDFTATVLDNTKITLDKTNISLQRGYTGYLTATVTPSEIAAKGVTFTSSNTAVASVSNNGTTSATVIGNSQGTATIYATASDGTSTSCLVTVGVPVSSVKMPQTDTTVNAGTTFALYAYAEPANATNPALTWSSSDEEVATVNASGQVTTWNNGTASITAKAADGSGASASCTVHVIGTPVTHVPTPTPTPTPTPVVPTNTPDGSGYSPPSGGITAYVNTVSGSLNLRANPSQNANILDRIPQNAAFILLSNDGTWCRAWYRGNYGYVMSKFVRTTGVLPTPDPYATATPVPVITIAPDSPSGTVAFVNTEKGSLNLRAQASTGATVLRTIPENGSFTVITYGTNWCYAWYKGTTGYVMTKYVRLAGSTSLPSGGTPKPAVPVTPSPAPLSGSVAQVVTPSGDLNMRTSPTTYSNRVRLIPQGAIVDVITYGKEWCYVRYKGSVGYCMTKFLYLGSGVNTNTSTATVSPGVTTKPSATVPVSGGGVQYAQVSTVKGGLNLRQGAGTGYTRILIIPQNAYVRVTEKGTTWCRVNYNGYDGYVMTSFLKMI